MPMFTIVGYYPDNNQPYTSAFEAADWEAAIEAARDEIDAPLEICGVLKGDCEVADTLDETMNIIPIFE